MGAEKQIRVIVADTAFIIRKGLRALLEEHAGFLCVAEASSTEELKNVLSHTNADVLIIDHCCNDCFSVEVIADVMQLYNALNVLVISHEKSQEEIRRIINLGVRTYLLKDCGEEEIIEALIACTKGEKYFCGQIIDVLLEKEPSTPGFCATGALSEREAEVIRQLVTGRRPKEIAAIMHLSYHTIVTHKRNIYAKLGISNTVELAMYAVKTGLSPDL